MSFSPEWETAYENGQRKPAGITGSLIVLFNNFIGHLAGQKILELGCGVGPNLRYLSLSEADYYGVDASHSAVDEATDQGIHHGIDPSHFACCDFTLGQPFGGEFDVVFDRASISHNPCAGIKSTMETVYAALKPGGIFIGSDWFSQSHDEFKRGLGVDAHTRRGYPDGQFAGTGNVHFADEGELRDLFQWGQSLWIVERLTRYPKVGLFMSQPHQASWIGKDFEGTEYISAVFDFVVRKPV